MPESKVRPEARRKATAKDRRRVEERRAEKAQQATDRSWVPWVFVPVGIIGVLWLVVYYVAGYQIPGMKELGDWNMLIGMGLLAAAFGIATLWK